VETLSKRLQREGTMNNIDDAGDPLENEKQNKRGGDVVEDERCGAADWMCRAHRREFDGLAAR